MSEKHFVADPFRGRVQSVVERVERSTSAEVVVVVRGRSAGYEGARHTTGALFAMAMLLVLLFHPREFAVTGMPAAVLTLYLAGYFLAKISPHALRWLTSSSTLGDHVRTRAAQSFLDHRVSSTRDRRGVLVFVSLLERRARVLPDVGLTLEALGPMWLRANEALEASVAAVDAERFLVALDALGAALAKAYPPSEGDTNELSDESRSES